MFRLLVALWSLASFSRSQDVKTENFEISDAKADSCAKIVELSTFDGVCCSLNSTEANGCVLNIVNGRCKVGKQLRYCCAFSIGIVVALAAAVFHDEYDKSDFSKLCILLSLIIFPLSDLGTILDD